MSKQQETLDRLRSAALEGDMDNIGQAAQEVLDAGISAYDAVNKGIAEGLFAAGEKFANKQYFLADLMACAEATNIALEILNPHLEKEQGEFKGTVLIAVVEGDIHDIGKSIVAALLRSAGFKVYDIGVDVPAAQIVDKAKEVNADIVATGAFLSPVRPRQKEIEDLLRAAGMKDTVKTLIGGSICSELWAQEIGADAYAANAADAVIKANAFMASKEEKNE